MVLFWMTVYCETRKQILTLTCSRQDCLLLSVCKGVADRCCDSPWPWPAIKVGW